MNNISTVSPEMAEMLALRGFKPDGQTPLKPLKPRPAYKRRQKVCGFEYEREALDFWQDTPLRNSQRWHIDGNKHDMGFGLGVCHLKEKYRIRRVANPNIGRVVEVNALEYEIIARTQDPISPHWEPVDAKTPLNDGLPDGFPSNGEKVVAAYKAANGGKEPETLAEVIAFFKKSWGKRKTAKI